MTHEELLALLDEYGHWDDWGFYPPLRAVVELHKPEIFNDGYKDVTVCEECNDHYISIEENYYPCLTIQIIEQVIEKELGTDSGSHQ